MKILKTKGYIFIFLCILLTACTGNWQRWVDSSDEEVKIIRYDEVMDDFVSLNSYSALQRLNSEYSLQTSMLIEDVLAIGNVQDPGIDRKLRAFYQDSIVQGLYREVRRQYGDMDPEEEILSEVFTKLKEADSGFVVPVIYTQVCALNESIVISDSLVGVGLDKYLGVDYPLYKNYYYASPIDFLHLIDNASFLVVSSFHGTAFSINMNKEFITVSPRRFNSRIDSLLSLVNLTNRKVSSVEDFNMDILSEKINYNQVNDILSNERMKSLGFIKTNILN